MKDNVPLVTPRNPQLAQSTDFQSEIHESNDSVSNSSGSSNNPTTGTHSQHVPFEAANLFKRKALSKKEDLENGEEGGESKRNYQTQSQIRSQWRGTASTLNEKKPLGFAPTGHVMLELTRLHTNAKKKGLRAKMHERLYEKQQSNKGESHILDKISKIAFPAFFLLFNFVFVLFVYIHWQEDEKFSENFETP